MSKTTADIVNYCRDQFPALKREENGKPVVFFDGPAGTQVPQCVIDAFSDYLIRCNANHGGLFGTSRESDELLDRAHQVFADWVGADDPSEIIFGQNMTSLTFAFSRALCKTWHEGDEIVVTRLDHDANVTPWVLAAEERGVVVRYVDFSREDFTLDLEDFKKQLNAKTKLVAVGCASNATGGINPVREICRLSHEFGAKVFLDAVHFGPHGLIDVKDWGCDFLTCSAYKFFGPHLGILWGKGDVLDDLKAFKVRPAPARKLGKWMTGTQSHESIAAGMACVMYMVKLGHYVSGDESLGVRASLIQAFKWIHEYETELAVRLIDGLQSIPGIKVYGITDADQFDQRFATVSITHSEIPTQQVAQSLAEEGVYVWHGHYYALQFTETLGLEPEGMVRIGLLHYNTSDEVDRLLSVLQSAVATTSGESV